MSTFIKNTKNPKNGKFENAIWMDDHFGEHHYGVQFLDGSIIDPEHTTLETNDDETILSFEDFEPNVERQAEQKCPCNDGAYVVQKHLKGCKYYIEEKADNNKCTRCNGTDLQCNVPGCKCMGSDQEIVICAAVRMSDGYIVRGHRHSDALRTASGIPRYHGEKWSGYDQGFVTSKNRYVNRTEGCNIQKAAGIKSYYETHRGDPTGAYLMGELYSEDLY